MFPRNKTLGATVIAWPFSIQQYGSTVSTVLYVDFIISKSGGNYLGQIMTNNDK